MREQGDFQEFNERIRGCAGCRLSQTRVNALCGEGNTCSRLMLIAQAPGTKEDIEGRMFIGPSGKVLDELLEAAGVGRDEIYMTNLVKCHLPGNRKPKQDEIDACGRHLAKEIELVSPEVLVPMGYYASRYILGDCEVDLPEPKREFSGVYGKLYRCGDRRAFPLPHPSSVLYNRSNLEGMKRLYEKIGVLSRECKWYPVCPLKRATEQELIDKRWVDLYCKGYWESCVRFQKEEAMEPHPDSMLPDGSIDQRLSAMGYGKGLDDNAH